MTNLKESTKRAIRTALQVLGTFAFLVVAVSIPPVETAINSWLGLVHPGTVLPTGIVASFGLIGTALAGVVSKLQNLAEGKDNPAPTDVTGWAEKAQELEASIADLKAAIVAAIQTGNPTPPGD